MLQLKFSGKCLGGKLLICIEKKKIVISVLLTFIYDIWKVEMIM